MLRTLFRLLAFPVFAASAHPVYGIAVTMNTDSAKAVLEAMQNPDLSHAEATKIAQIYGNQGAIRKLNEFNIPATTASFANALYAEAHGEKVTDPAEADFLLDMVRPKAPHLLALIQQIENTPQTFQAPIEQRIAMFTPPHTNIHLNGYIVAAGDGGGYAFGTTDFYLNLGIIDELVVANGVTTMRCITRPRELLRRIATWLRKVHRIRRTPQSGVVRLRRGFSRACTKKVRL